MRIMKPSQVDIEAMPQSLRPVNSTMSTFSLMGAAQLFAKFGVSAHCQALKIEESASTSASGEPELKWLRRYGRMLAPVEQ